MTKEEIHADVVFEVNHGPDGADHGRVRRRNGTIRLGRKIDRHAFLARNGAGIFSILALDTYVGLLNL